MVFITPRQLRATPHSKQLACPSTRVFTPGGVQPDQSAGRAPSRPSRPLIFVVDDEPVLLELATTLLEPLACRVKTFRNAEAALSAFDTADPRPALVITDYSMHVMNGLELIAECRQRQPRQKTLLVSGTADESIYENSPVKPDRFLSKPYNARQF